MSWMELSQKSSWAIWPTYHWDRNHVTHMEREWVRTKVVIEIWILHSHASLKNEWHNQRFSETSKNKADPCLFRRSDWKNLFLFDINCKLVLFSHDFFYFGPSIEESLEGNNSWFNGDGGHMLHDLLVGRGEQRVHKSYLSASAAWRVGCSIEVEASQRVSPGCGRMGVQPITRSL